MKKLIGILLGLCFLFIPFVANAETKAKIDVSKYNTLNLEKTLAEEEITPEFENYKENDKQITIYLFRGKGCGYCRSFLTFLNGITNEYGKYFKLVSFETWYDKDNNELLSEISNFVGQSAQGVPYIVIGDQIFPGYASSYDEGIKEAITTLYDSDDRYDIFEEYNKKIDEEEKAANAGTTKTIVWNFVFVSVATIIMVIVVKSAENNILEELAMNGKTVSHAKTKEYIKFESNDDEEDDEDEEEVVEHKPTKKSSSKKSNTKKTGTKTKSAKK